MLLRPTLPTALVLLTMALPTPALHATVTEDGLGPRAERTPAGTDRVRVYLKDGETPVDFRTTHLPGTPLLSHRIGPFLELALTAAEIDYLRAHGYRHEIQLPTSADLRVNPTEYLYAQMVSELQGFAATYPSLCELTAYPGSTHDGRTTYELKLSDNVAQEEDEFTLFFVGVHHGGEMIGCDILMKFLTDTLASYGTDPVKTQWVDDHETRIIVIGNPDGWNNNETGVTSGWRKNNRDNNSSGQFEPGADGVDINRNFNFLWNLNGSGNQGASDYRGPTPGSEPEAVVSQNLVLAERPTIAVSWHMSGEILFIPWNWGGTPTPDEPAYLDFAQGIGDQIPKQNGVGTYPPVVETRVGGFLDDYIYGLTGGFCTTIEVTWSPGLGPITDVIDNNQGAFPAIYSRAAGPQITGLITDVVTGAPLSAKIEILEINTNELPDRTSEPAFGRYAWLTLPGTYTLRVSRAGYHTQVISNVVVPAGGPATVDVALTPYYHSYGTGLAGGLGFVPDLNGSGDPILNNFMSLDLTDGLGGATALYLLGLTAVSQPAWGGTLLVGPPTTPLFVTLSGAAGVPGAGTFALSGTVPNNPALQGVTAYCQVLVADPAAPASIALSGGLEIHLE